MQIVLGGGGQDLVFPELDELAAENQALARSGDINPEFSRRFERLVSSTKMFVDRIGTRREARDPEQLRKLQAFAREVQGLGPEVAVADDVSAPAVPISEETFLLGLFLEGVTDPAEARARMRKQVPAPASPPPPPAPPASSKGK